MTSDKRETRTGGREATNAVIPGRFALSVGKPDSETPPGWSWTRLTDVARLETGHTPSRKHPEYWDGDIPWVGIKDATNNHGTVIEDTFQHATQLGIENSSARVLPANTVCLSRTASVGYVVIMGQPMATSQDFVNWVCSDKLDYRYLASILVAESSSYALFSRGTTHQTIYFPEVKAFHVLLPPIEEQKRIANIIWTLNDKIQLNHQINQTLEQMAQAIFKSWFVDFEPVKAKIAALEAGSSEEDALLAAMQAISGTSLFDADASAAGAEAELARLQAEQPEQYAELRATAKLFPSAMQGSELGEIPVGWSVSQIGDEVTVVGGGTPSTKNPIFWEGGRISWTSPKDLSNLVDKVLVETERKITEAGLAKISSGLLPINTVLMSSRASVGYLAMAKIPVAVNQGYIAMKCEKVLSPEFVIQWCEAHMDEIKSRASGTTFAEISKKNFKIIPVVVPPESLMSAYTRQVLPLYEAIEINVRESDNLAQLRDTLLPKLLSGELSLTTTVFEPDSRNVADATA